MYVGFTRIGPWGDIFKLRLLTPVTAYNAPFQHALVPFLGPPRKSPPLSSLMNLGYSP